MSAGLIDNHNARYKRLAAKTAETHRDGTFPELIDRGRSIHRYEYRDDPADALDDPADNYRLDRSAGQDASLYAGMEKAGMIIQLQTWFGDLGIPVLSLDGYSSQSYVDQVVRAVPAGDPALRRRLRPLRRGHRPRLHRTHRLLDKVIRVALSAAQIQQRRLPIKPGKEKDSRAAGFIELDALPPDDLRRLFQAVIDEHWDMSRYQQVLERQEADRDRLRQAATALDTA